MGLEQKNELAVINSRVVRIIKPEGIYTLIYGIHDTEQSLSLLPDDFDGLVLERSINLTTDIETIVKKKINDSIQDRNFITESARRRLPIYFVDREFNLVTDLVPFCVFGGLEFIFGGVAACEALGRIAQKKVTRRDFLKLGVGLWALNSTAGSSGLLWATSSLNINERVSAEWTRWAEKLHPEVNSLLLTSRNVLIAQKEQFLMEKLGRSHLITSIGGAHVGLEDQILSGTPERIEFLQKIKPLLKTFYDTPSLYQIARFDFDGDNWQMGELMEVPELKNLLVS